MRTPYKDRTIGATENRLWKLTVTKNKSFIKAGMGLNIPREVLKSQLWAKELILKAESQAGHNSNFKNLYEKSLNKAHTVNKSMCIIKMIK